MAKTSGPTSAVPSVPRPPVEEGPAQLSRRSWLLKAIVAAPMSALIAARVSAQQPPPPPCGSAGLGTGPCPPGVRPGQMEPTGPQQGAPPAIEETQLDVRRANPPALRAGDTLDLPSRFDMLPRLAPGGLPTLSIFQANDLVGELVMDPSRGDRSSYRGAAIVNGDGQVIARVSESVNAPDLLRGKKASGRSITLYEQLPGGRAREVASFWRRPDGKYEVREPNGTVVATSDKFGRNPKNPTILFETEAGERIGAIALAGASGSSAQISVQTLPGNPDAPVAAGSSITNRQFGWLMAAGGAGALDAEIDDALAKQAGGPTWRDRLGIGGGGGGLGWLSGWIQVFTGWGSFGVGGGTGFGGGYYRRGSYGYGPGPFGMWGAGY